MVGEGGEEPYFHDQIVYCDDTPDSKVQMNVWRRELGIRVHTARKARMRRLSYEWLAGLREIMIDPERYAMMDGYCEVRQCLLSSFFSPYSSSCGCWHAPW